MKKYVGLARVFLLSYLVVVFGGTLLALLLIKDNQGAAIAMAILAGLDLAAFIVARVIFSKYYLAFLIVSLSALLVLNGLVLGGFILEIIYTNNGLSAKYAWFISIASLVLLAVIDLFYGLGVHKIHRKRLIAEGIIQESSFEEDI